jgi:hypothetical protein
MVPKKDLTAISHILPNIESFPKSRGQHDPSTLLLRLSMQWHRIVGKSLAIATSPLEIRHRQLWVGVNDPVLLFECQQQNSKWLDLIHSFLNQAHFSKIIFRHMATLPDLTTAGDDSSLQLKNNKKRDE